MRIFLDANILFSAAKTDGAIRALLRLLDAASHECCAGGYVLEEARRNLAAKAPERLSALEPVLAVVKIAETQASAASQLPSGLPEKDQPVIAAAVRLGCDALVTGDRTHFGALYGKSIAGVRIHSPRSLAEALL